MPVVREFNNNFQVEITLENSCSVCGVYCFVSEIKSIRSMLNTCSLYNINALKIKYHCL